MNRHERASDGSDFIQEPGIAGPLFGEPEQAPEEQQKFGLGPRYHRKADEEGEPRRFEKGANMNE